MRGMTVTAVSLAALVALISGCAVAAPVCPLKVGQTYDYELAMNGEPVGTFTVTCEKGAGDTLKVTNTMDATIKGTDVQHESATTVGKDLRPTQCTAKGKVGAVSYEYTCTFDHAGKKVTTKGQRQGVQMSSTVKLPDGWEFMDNNDMACFSLLSARLGVEPGVVRSAQCFHGFSGQTVLCNFVLKDSAGVKFGAKTYETTVCELYELKVKQWLAEDGLLIKGEQGPMAYTLLP